MSRRIVVNLTFFAAIGVALAVWAATNVLTFDFLERPYTVTAEFSTSPGLSPHFEVTYLGQKVGAISSVALADQRVVVELEIERGVELPESVDAYVRRKSAVGEPYVDLVPRAATNPAEGARLADGYVIPLERTFTPLAYSDLFMALDELVAAVSPDDLQTLVHELAVGLDGRAGSIRQILVGADALTADLAANVDLLDGFLVELTRLTHTFATHRDSVMGAVDDLAALSATLAQANADVAALLEDGTTFASRLADVVAASKAGLGCTIDGLGALGTRLDAETVAALSHLISLSPRFLFVLEGIRDPDGFSRGTLGFNGGENPPPVYLEPLPLPVVPEVAACAPVATTEGGQNAPAATPVPGSPVATPVAPDRGFEETAPAPGPDTGAGEQARRREPGGDGGLPLWLVLLAIVLAGAVWRWLYLSRRRGQPVVDVDGVGDRP